MAVLAQLVFLVLELETAALDTFVLKHVSSIFNLKNIFIHVYVLESTSTGPRTVIHQGCLPNGPTLRERSCQKPARDS